MGASCFLLCGNYYNPSKKTEKDYSHSFTASSGPSLYELCISVCHIVVGIMELTIVFILFY